MSALFLGDLAMVETLPPPLQSLDDVSRVRAFLRLLLLHSQDKEDMTKGNGIMLFTVVKDEEASTSVEPFSSSSCIHHHHMVNIIIILMDPKEERLRVPPPFLCLLL